MSRSLRPSTFCSLLAVLPYLTLCVSNSSRAQTPVTVSQGDCSEGNAPCTTITPQQGANASQLDIEGPPPFPLGQVAIVSTGGPVFGLQDAAAVVKNEPYQAEAVTEMKQTLADGSHIVQTTTATVARDSDGRTARIQKLSTIGPWRSADSAQGNSQTLTTIFDPVAKEHIDYTSNSKVAHVLTMPPLPPGAVVGAARGFSVSAPAPLGGADSAFAVAGPAPVDGAVQGFAVQARAISPQMSKDMEPKTESLGMKSIEGVQVTGTRSTSTVPAGTIGNDKNLVITRETWYSPELKLVMQSTQSDPRFGQTIYTIKDIQQGAPDEALFQIPADYKVEKIVPKIAKAPTQ